LDYKEKGKIGITFSCFDLLHAGHVVMLEEAKRHCDYLIVGLQTDPTIDRPEKNAPLQSIVERQIQLAGIKYVDEIITYTTEADLIDLLLTLPIDMRIVGEDYKNNDFTGKELCIQQKIKIIYNSRKHSFSTTSLRERLHESSNNRK
jgi:glycerol-3-phosphate cytidylyltransferase|tara:strand:+ start:2122 stop:2562 length:441 start_codon:yes stop_codon:yes gene_type:complete